VKTKRKQQPQRDRVERLPDDVLWCQWSSTTHAPCHKIAEPGLPFCLYYIAAAHGMARGASTPDEKTRALFEEVWEAFEDDKGV
jgi:hypothetical protein